MCLKDKEPKIAGDQLQLGKGGRKPSQPRKGEGGAMPGDWVSGFGVFHWDSEVARFVTSSQRAPWEGDAFSTPRLANMCRTALSRAGCGDTWVRPGGFLWPVQGSGSHDPGPGSGCPFLHSGRRLPEGGNRFKSCHQHSPAVALGKSVCASVSQGEQ